MKRVIWFEIRVDDPAPVMKFYEALFGWNFRLSDIPGDYWIIEAGEPGGPGVTGAMTRRTPEFRQGDSTVVYVRVDALDAVASAAAQLGGTLVKEPTEISEEDGWYALVRDPEGNLIGAWAPSRGAD